MRNVLYISKDCYQTVVPCLVASVSSRFESSVVFFTMDGSKGEAGTRFGVYQLSGGEISFHIRIVDNFHGLGPNQRSPPW
jgi:hypothetical protein